jgi:hypothetical protein
MTQIKKRFSVALDIKRSVSNRAFEVVEGDNGNIIDVTLTDDGQPVDLSGCRVLAVFSKSNGTSSQDSAVEGGGVSVDENRVSISLFIPSFAPGMVECELQVYSGVAQTTLVTSAKFNFKCRRGILNSDAVKATDEHPLLVGLIEQCRGLEQSFSNFSLEEQTRRASEEGRAYAENEREVAETQRELAETARTAGEATRVQAEGVRQALYGEIASAYASGALKGDRGDKGEKGDKGDMGDVSYHAFQHAAGGTDALSPATIGAAAASHAHGGITSDGRLGTEANRAVCTGEGGTLQAGILPVAAGGTGSSDAAAARAALGAASAADLTAANTGIAALQKAEQVFNTSGTAPNFTVADAGVAAYTNGLRRTVQFHAAGANATLNFNDLGAKALYEYIGKQMSVKAGQAVEVCYNGTYFFGVSVGGGVELPTTPVAGDTVLYSGIAQKTVSATKLGTNDYISNYADCGWGFTAKIAGIYRIVFEATYTQNGGAAKLQLNGVDVANSETAVLTIKSIDVAVPANGTVKLWLRADPRYDYAAGGVTWAQRFEVRLLAADVQAAMNAFITVIA